MKVKRLKMTAFRGISDLTLEFDTAEPTVFIGINGVGKSSILDCLAILLSRLTARIQFNPESKALLSRKSLLASQERFYSKQDVKNGENKTHSDITVSFDSQDVKWSLTASNIRVGINRERDFKELDQATKNIRRQWQENPKANIPLVIYYPVNRAVFDIPLEIPKTNQLRQVDAYEQALAGVKIDFDSFFQWFRAVEDLENEERQDDPDYRDQQLEAVRKAISALMPDFKRLRVRRAPLRMTLIKQDQELIINQLSDGEKCLLAMVGDLARRLAIANPGLSDPLQGSGVILIDEIELHLHPSWQRGIIPDLTRTFPNCQFIVTTHSPQVISDVKPDNIYILEAADAGIVAKRPESSFGRDSNRILEDLMGVPERPQKIKDRLRNLFRLIDDGNLAEAKQLQKQLEDEIGVDEPEFASADVLIRRKEILGR